MDANEIIKAATTGAAAGGAFVISTTAKKFLEIVTERGTEPLGEYFSTRMLVWRAKNVERLLNRADELLKKSGVAPQTVPNAILLPLVEAAANVDDETLAEMFAKLLASAVTEKDGHHPAFPRIIAELSPIDAKILALISSGATIAMEFSTGRLPAALEQEMKVSRITAEMALSNLRRLGILGDGQFSVPKLRFDTPQDGRVTRTTVVTPLGRRLVAVCLATERAQD